MALIDSLSCAISHMGFFIRLFWFFSPFARTPCLTPLAESAVLSLPWCISVLMRTLRGRGTWQHQSQTPMLCSCLSQGTRQEPRGSVQVHRLRVPIQKHILLLWGMHLKKQMARIHRALWQPSCWQCQMWDTTVLLETINGIQLSLWYSKGTEVTANGK